MTWAMKIISIAIRFAFIEWPELIEELLPANAKKVTITTLEDGTREIEM